MARLQQVKNLSQLNEAQHFLADHIYTHTHIMQDSELLLQPCFSILDYELLDLEIPTINVVGRIIEAGIPVLVYR